MQKIVYKSLKEAERENIKQESLANPKIALNLVAEREERIII